VINEIETYGHARQQQVLGHAVLLQHDGTASRYVLIHKISKWKLEVGTVRELAINVGDTASWTVDESPTCCSLVNEVQYVVGDWRVMLYTVANHRACSAYNLAMNATPMYGIFI
jgi:hypothetical protein